MRHLCRTIEVTTRFTCDINENKSKKRINNKVNRGHTTGLMDEDGVSELIIDNKLIG